MYETLKTYPTCAIYNTRENYQDPASNFALNPKKVFIDSPELRSKRRGGMGIDSYKPGNIEKKSCCYSREGFSHTK